MHKPIQFLLFKDGNQWCAAPTDFRECDGDPTGWGITRVEAVFKLLENQDFLRLAAQHGWSLPTFNDFVEMSIDSPPLQETAIRQDALPRVASAHRTCW
jgi:hypothetical protein